MQSSCMPTESQAIPKPNIDVNLLLINLHSLKKFIYYKYLKSGIGHQIFEEQ